MATYTIIEKNSGKVLNQIEWDGDIKKLILPDEQLAIEGKSAPGDKWDGSKLVPLSDEVYLAKMEVEQAIEDAQVVEVDLLDKLDIGTASNEEVQMAIAYLIRASKQQIVWAN